MQTQTQTVSQRKEFTYVVEYEAGNRALYAKVKAYNMDHAARIVTLAGYNVTDVFTIN